MYGCSDYSLKTNSSLLTFVESMQVSLADYLMYNKESMMNIMTNARAKVYVTQMTSRMTVA